MPRPTAALSSCNRSRPTAGATQVPSDAPIEVRFTDPLSAQSPTPSLTPAVAGSWQEVDPDHLRLRGQRPARAFVFGDGYRARRQQRRGEFDGQAPPRHGDRQVQRGRRQRACGSSSCWPSSATSRSASRRRGRSPLLSEAADPQQGAFTWRSNEPASPQLTVDRRHHEHHHHWRHHGLRVEPQPHNRRRRPARRFGAQLLADAAAGTVNTAPYNYVYVSKGSPETATVYSNGAAVYYDTGQHRRGRGANRVGDLSRLRALPGDHHERAPTPTARTTSTRASPG